MKLLLTLMLVAAILIGTMVKEEMIDKDNNDT